MCFGRIHPDKGTARGDRPSRAAPGARSCCAARCRTSATSREGRAAHRRRARPLPRLGGPGAARPRCLAAPRACCIRSRSRSRSGSRWWSRCSAAPRSSPIARGSMPELVEDGVTGRAGRRACRLQPRPSSAPRAWIAPAAAGRRSSVSARGSMVDDYLEVYEASLRDRERSRSSPGTPATRCSRPSAGPIRSTL